jgi:hypothetical protein
LTIFSTAKPFEGEAGVHQRNAMTSWVLLRPRPDVILLGDEPGASDVCGQLGLRHVPHVARTDSGTPLISDLLTQAHDLGRGDILCYVNADIVLMQDFADALQRIISWRPKRPFLAIGGRWTVRVDDPIDFSRDWELRLRQAVADGAWIRGPMAMDFFAFPRGLYRHPPAFAVGRPFWDNWMVYEAWVRRMPIIDLTAAATVVHQDHEYKPQVAKEGRLYPEEESDRNYALAGPAAIEFGLRDATHVMIGRSVHPAWRARGLKTWLLQRFRQKFVLLQTSHPVLRIPFRLGRSLYHRLRPSAGPMGWSGPQT